MDLGTAHCRRRLPAPRASMPLLSLVRGSRACCPCRGALSALSHSQSLSSAGRRRLPAPRLPSPGRDQPTGRRDDRKSNSGNSEDATFMRLRHKQVPPSPRLIKKGDEQTPPCCVNRAKAKRLRPWFSCCLSASPCLQQQCWCRFQAGSGNDPTPCRSAWPWDWAGRRQSCCTAPVPG